jgi:hypothetical protein
MKKIIFKYFLFVICGLILAACDFLTSSGSKSKTVAGWKCTEILAQNKILCRNGKQKTSVTLDHLIIPGAANETEKQILVEQTMFSSNLLAKCAADALECVSELVLNQSVKILPEPKKEQTEVNAQVFTSRKTDVAETLLKEGLAIVKKNNSPGSYFEFQKQAINLERGLWKSSEVFDKRFAITVKAEITPAEEAERPVQSLKGLRRFHSPDLIRASSLKDADVSKEVKSMILTKSEAHISFEVKPPPKNYDITVFFRPQVRANIYSGPLDSFEKKEMKWKEKNLKIKGGESIDVKIEYELLELSSVKRGTQDVYSGYIVEGYDVEITADAETIFRKSEIISDKKIFEKLNNKESGLF